MQRPTDPPSSRLGTPGRVNALLVAVFVGSTLAAGYGFGVLAGVLPPRSLVAILEYVVLVVGGLVSGLTALVLWWRWRQEQPRKLTWGQVVLTSVLAPVVPLGAVLVMERLRTGAFAVPRLFGWMCFGVLVVSAQFALGAGTGRQHGLRGAQSWRLLLGECVGVFAVVVTLLTLTAASPDFEANLSFAGGACLLLLLFGGPLYLLGRHLSYAPE